MAEMTNAPRRTVRGASRKDNQVQDTRRPDLSRCDESCGPCWLTYVEDQRWCEVEVTNAARRDLREALEAGGDRA